MVRGGRGAQTVDADPEALERQLSDMLGPRSR
jgi:hypothetical protein